MVKFLLSAGADQEHKTDEMHTALMEAAMDGHVEVARLLLDSGAQVNLEDDRLLKWEKWPWINWLLLTELRIV